MTALDRLNLLARRLMPLADVTVENPPLHGMMTDEHVVVRVDGEEVATCYRLDDAVDTLKQMSGDLI